MRYLTEEWLAAAVEIGGNVEPRPGVSLEVQHVVIGGPDGDVKYRAVIEDGRVVEATFGELPDAEVVLTRTYADAVAIDQGSLNANAAFMQGRLKVAGTVGMGRLLPYLPVLNAPDHRAALEALAARTDWA